jgi:hypothetical protein
MGMIERMDVQSHLEESTKRTKIAEKGLKDSKRFILARSLINHFNDLEKNFQNKLLSFIEEKLVNEPDLF